MNQPAGNSQIQQQQPIGTFTINSTTFNQGPFNNNNNNNTQQPPVLDQRPSFANNNASAISKKISDPPTPVSEQSSSFNQEQEQTDAPDTLAADSLLAKKVHKGLRDPQALVVDRSDPNSPLFSLTTFEQLNLNPELLKGKLTYSFKTFHFILLYCKGIYNMDFRSPSKIQAIALPNLLSNPRSKFNKSSKIYL